MALQNSRLHSAAFGAKASELDAGLRAYMLKVYNLMALGVAGTGVLTMVMAMNPQLTYQLAVGPMRWVLFFMLLGMGWFSPKIMTMRSASTAYIYFAAYCALWGVMISPWILMFLQTPEGIMDIARAFFITAGAFAGLSLYGYSTKKDLGPMAAFAGMAVFGLIIAGLVNMIFFEYSSGFSLFFSVATVGLFAIITAFQVQQIKSMYSQNYGSGVVERYAIFGALQLYGSFVVMFIHILSIIGIMRSE